MRPLALALLASAALLRSAEAPTRLHLSEGRRDGRVEVSAENTDPDAVRWLWVSLAAAQNVASDPPLPSGFTLKPLERRYLFTLRALQPQAGYSYGLRSLEGVGDPAAEPDPSAVYLLPFAHGTKHLVSQGYFGAATHQGLRALDFDMPDGTGVHAARDGVVIEVKQDSAEGGPSAVYAGDGNDIQVMHADATWAVYAHLSPGGARVQVGQSVKAGQLIGLSGHTGLASGPHLHFAVYRAGWEGPSTVATVFRTGLSATASLEEGRTYYAWQPGGAPFTPVLGEALRDEDFRGTTRPASGGRVTLRQERIDRRTLVWAANGTAEAIDLSVDFAQADHARASVALPFHSRVPARTEAYCFFVDFIGGGASDFQLKAAWRPLSPRPRRRE